MSPRIERIGPYTYLVIGADKYLLTAEDCKRLSRELLGDYAQMVGPGTDRVMQGG